MNVVTTSVAAGTPWPSRETARNCAEPAYTMNDMAMIAHEGRPAVVPSMPYAIPMGT